jgi:hypothetical protein
MKNYNIITHKNNEDVEYILKGDKRNIHNTSICVNTWCAHIVTIVNIEFLGVV